MPFDNSYMKKIYSMTNPEQLESILKQMLRQLVGIVPFLQAEAGKPDIDVWIKQIKQLKAQAIYQRTVVGIVGNTGAGKSSVLNALFGEGFMLPTSCMRACTAVVTEISWNKSSDPMERYRAEIEFIDEESWMNELDTLFKEIHEDNGAFISDPTSNAGVAYDKVRAVYPNINQEDLRNSTFKNLLQRPHVRDCLGITEVLFSDNDVTFRNQLLKYVDTANDKQKGPKLPEWWPLIKCVRIYTKAPVLSAGAVLVDLPGTHDSNAARAAVADDYMKQCNGLWIVAPINRAVNDKAAKTLLGAQFKRQMKFDGMLNNVTFICSKTDDILVDEAVRQLKLQNQMDIIDVEKRAVEAELANFEIRLRENRIAVRDLKIDHKEVHDQRRVWFKLRRDLGADEDKVVFAPLNPTSRKRSLPNDFYSSGQKRPRMDADASDEPKFDPGSFTDDDDDIDDDAQNATPLTMIDINTKLQELEAMKTQFEQKIIALEEEQDGLKASVTALETRLTTFTPRKLAICIAARNEWSRGEIKRHYAAGIRELDQECAEQEDGDNFNPDAVIRDYKGIERSLPVFCVSSRSYQVLCGRFLGDERSSSLQTAEATEMPQLISHCMKMTEETRVQSVRRVLEDLQKLLVSLRLYSAADGCGVKPSSQERTKARSALVRKLKNLEKDLLETACLGTLHDLEVAQSEHIGQFVERATRSAVKQAIPCVQLWAAPEPDGGMHWATYRAVVRRYGGPYKTSRGGFNFNKDLSALFEKHIVSAWEKCFQHIMPKIARLMGENMTMMIRNFHEKVEEQARDHNFGVAGVILMSQKLDSWERVFKNLSERLVGMISNFQKGANREIAPVVAEMMAVGFKQAAEHTGIYFSSVGDVLEDC